MVDQVELRIDPVVTTADDQVVTRDDAHRLHEFPDTLERPQDRVTVAIMDSGIHPETANSHPWFKNAEVTKRADFTGEGIGADKVGHGTGCASIYAGNMPAVELYSVRIFGSSGRTGFTTIRNAYEWLIDHADEIDVVNMSWGARRNIPQINNLHEKLVNAGVHDVVAAGNTGTDGGSPATSRKAFSAGAVTEEGDPTRFSSVDPEQDNPDVAAVGKNVKMARAPGTSMGTPINDQFTKASGTSFAAPYTGAAYGIALYHKRMSWDRRFEKAAPDIPGTPKDGEGLLKLKSALEGETAPAPNPTTQASIWTFLGNDTVWMQADWLEDGDKTVTLMDESKDHVDLRFEK